MFTDLVPDWTPEERAELVQFIETQYTEPYIQIHAAGSRVYGGFHERSDLDAVVWIEEPDTEYFLRRVPIFHSIRISIKIETQPEDGSMRRLWNVGWPHKPEGLDLTMYCLSTNKLIPGKIEDENFYREFKRSIRENKGLCSCCPDKPWGLPA